MNLEDARLRAAARIVERLVAAGHRAYVAGGAVRDHVLGVVPHDVDVATSARPEETAALFEGTKLVGATFGVVLVPQGGETIEIATFRREGPYLDGRRPSSVEFASEEEDCRRRDFTVNGLLLDPATGRLIDHVRGLEDLKARVLRAIGDPHERFREDHLRLLRAVRLAAQLDFEIAEDTLSAVRDLAPFVSKVAPERVRDELTRLLTGPAPRRGLDLLDDSGLLSEILPEVAAMRGVAQPPEFHPEGDVFVHTLALFDHLESPSLELAFGALLHDVGKPPTYTEAEDRIRFPRHDKLGAAMADDICRRLRFSNDSRELVVELVAHHMRFQNVREMRLSTLKRFLRLPRFDEHLALHRADCLASHRDLTLWRFATEKLAELGEEELRPPRLVTGEDLLRIGYEAGPELGDALRRIEELQLEGIVTSRQDALERARRDLPK